MAISFEDSQDLTSRTDLPQRPARKQVEHGEGGSKADVSDLLDPIRRQEFRPELQTHIIRANLNCEATHASGSGHSGPATHFVQLQGEQEHQQTPVCDAHLGKIIENSISRGEYGVSKKRIHPEDVAKHLAFRGIQDREKRTYLESYLYSKGMRGEEALVGRTGEDLGKGGGKGADALQEAKARRTPEQQASTLERALERARTQGGHAPAEASPTVDVNGKSMTLADSYSHLASLRRKTEPEKYNLIGVRGPEGAAEAPPTPTRIYDLNKMGTPNTRGGRKKAIKTETWDTSNQDLPGYTEEEMQKNPELRKSHEERKAAGIPVGGIKPRGFSKNDNRRTEVTLTGLAKEAPEVSAIERFAKGREQRVTDLSFEDIQSNLEAERLRSIEAKKGKTAESRNAAFQVDWNDIPRP